MPADDGAGVAGEGRADEPDPPDPPGPPGPLIGPFEGPLEPGEPGAPLGEPEVPGLPGVLGLPLVALLALVPEGAELCGVLGVLTGVLGVLDGELLGVVAGVLDPLDGGLLLGPPEPPSPLIEIAWPPGSKRTCAVHGPFGWAEGSTRTWIEVWAPPASMPEVALRLSHGASGAAVQLSGAVPEFQRVTTTSLGLFERCDTVRCSCEVPLGSWEGAAVCVGCGLSGPLMGRLSAPLGEEEDGVAGSTAATTCAVTASVPARPAECTLPATGSAGPASGPDVGRG